MSENCKSSSCMTSAILNYFCPLSTRPFASCIHNESKGRFRQNLGRGLMLWLFVGPTGVYLLDFFCSGIQFNLLLSPYPCFISLLYLDLYVLGDDALIS